MSVPTYKLWIDGRDAEGHGEVIPVENPANGETIAYCHTASPKDTSNAIDIAQRTFKSGIWSATERSHRADILDSIATHLSAKLPELILLEVRQTGRCIREMQAQVPSLTKWFKYYAAVLRTEERPVLPTTGKLHNWIDRRPLGVVVQITPFNHPLLIAVKKIAPALAAGNSIVLKPSELTPLTSILLGKIMKEAGLPDGVFAVLPGYGNVTGEALVENPLVKKVDVTGGTPAGKVIGAIAGGHLAKFTAELGGKAPVIVTEKADVQLAVNGVAFGAFIASGQTCIAATRVIVHRDVYDEFVGKIVGKVLSINDRMGSPENPASMMGPLISAKQLAKVTELVDEALADGNEAVAGGSRPTHMSKLDGYDLSKGHFYSPTVLVYGSGSRLLDSRIWKEEAFGPVIVVVSYGTEEEALQLANDSEFGLGAAVWTQDLSQAHRMSSAIESGICWVNCHHRNDASSPWGRVGSSGVGSENGMEAYYSYTTMKSTIVNYASIEESLANDDWFREGASGVRYG